MLRLGSSRLLWICLLLAGLLGLEACSGVSAGSNQTGGGGGGGGGNGGGGSGTADFYVATDGNDSWSGTLPLPNTGNTDGPFATIGQAQQAVRAILRNPQGRTGTLTVQIRQGTYFLSQPLAFTTADSGTSQLQVSWENYPSETPFIDGGLNIGGGSSLSWKNVSGSTWQTTLPASTQYFEQLFYNGQRRLRPRLGGLLGTYYRVAATVYLPGQTDPNCSILVSGRGYECFDRFQYNPADPISASWSNLAAGDIELYSFEMWTVPKLRIKSVDTVNHIIYLSGPATQESQYHGFIPGHRYVVENVKNALIQPGQWFLDQSTSPWTLTYIANAGETPSTDSVVIPQASQLLVATGLQYVTFTGLAFQHDNFTVPPAGYSSPRQDTTITGAITCLNCQHVTFDGDVITQTSGGGIEFYTNSASATTTNNTIQNSGLYDIAGFGIRVGLPSAYSDTDSNVPQFNLVQNNLVASYGRMFPSAIGIVQGDGHDNTYIHNDIFDGYHSAVEICALGCIFGVKNSNGSFNNNVSFNHAYDIGQGMTDDMGCFYFNLGNDNNYATGTKILNNRCHDVVDAHTQDSDGYGGQGIYLDSRTSDVDVENNLVYRTSGLPMNMSNGPSQTLNPTPPANTIHNNIFAYGRGGMIGVSNPYTTNACPSHPVLQFNASSNIFFFDKSNANGGGFLLQRGCTYACGFPYPQFENFSSNLYWRTTGGFSTDPDAFHVQSLASPAGAPLCDSLNTYSSWTFETLSAWQGSGEDVQGTSKNPGFANPSCNQSSPESCVATAGQDDYTLSSSPGAGFTVFDSTQAGRQTPVIQAPPVPATFQTAPLNPSSDY